MAHETYTPDFVLTRDLIENSLVPSGYSGANTEKYFVDGFPEIVVRYNEGATVESSRAAREFYLKLGDYCIGLLNYSVVPHGGEAYIIAPKVHGLDLLEAVKEKALPVEAIDNLWKNITEYHRHAFKNKLPIAVDIIGHDQYVFGRTATEEEDKIYLVDLSEFSGELVPNTLMYCNSLILLSRNIVEAEEASGEELTGARMQLEKALASLPEDYEYRGALGRMVNAILTEKNLDMDFEDDIADYI